MTTATITATYAHHRFDNIEYWVIIPWYYGIILDLFHRKQQKSLMTRSNKNLKHLLRLVLPPGKGNRLDMSATHIWLKSSLINPHQSQKVINIPPVTPYSFKCK